MKYCRDCEFCIKLHDGYTRCGKYSHAYTTIDKWDPACADYEEYREEES